MTNIIITKTRRGLQSIEEWETFAGDWTKDSDPMDTRIFFKCRETYCSRTWTMKPEDYRQIDVKENPIPCPECGSFNINARWCVLDRPYTYVDNDLKNEFVDDIFEDLKEYRAHNQHPPLDHQVTLFPETTKHIVFRLNRNVPSRYDRNHFYEEFQRYIPENHEGHRTWHNRSGAPSDVTSWDHHTAENNKNFYRCILYSVSQKSIKGGTGGSA